MGSRQAGLISLPTSESGFNKKPRGFAVFDGQRNHATLLGLYVDWETMGYNQVVTLANSPRARRVFRVWPEATWAASRRT